MKAPKGSAAPASGTDIPDFATLAADPEIAPLLRFDPVVRKVKRPDGWTSELQRELIARIAAAGTVQAAVWQMGKHATGAEALYKTPGARSFRLSWDAAIIIGRRRNGLDSQPPFLGEVPGIQRRAKQGRHILADPQPEPADELPIDEEQKWHLIHTVGLKFMRKVAAERQARLNGEIVAADFYLRQVTVTEVMLDLMSADFGFDARQVLQSLHRGEHRLVEIVSTELTDWLDRSRRMWWAQEGAPERPPYPDASFLKWQPSPKRSLMLGAYLRFFLAA